MGCCTKLVDVNSFLLALAAAALAAGALACNANVTEGCATARCDYGQGGANGVAPTSSSSTGASGGGGLPMCSNVPITGDFPCEVFAVIHAKCNTCHQGYDPSTGM